jgi:dihydroceramide fatty acyl 2-hydroxylase
MKTNEKSVRLFQNEWLENLTHVPVWLPATIWLPVIAYFLFQTKMNNTVHWAQLVLIAISALVFWSLTEYLLHRFLFHAEFQNPKLQRMVFLLHGVHHDYPNDSERLLMPPLAAIPIAAIFYLLFSFVLGAELAQPFFAFFLVGYLIYDYIHYGTHHFRIKSTWMNSLKKNHMAHHYIAPDQYFGVSSPIWDRVFSTIR